MRLRPFAIISGAVLLGAGVLAGTPAVHADGPGASPSHPTTACCRPTPAASVDSPQAAIDARHDDLVAGWGSDLLGSATGPATAITGGAGWSRTYARGVLYALFGNRRPYVALDGTSSGRPADLALWEVHGQVYDKYISKAIAGPDGFLGYPTSDVQIAKSGDVSYFEHGGIYWSAIAGAHEVHGEIFNAYQRTAIDETTGPLGRPTSDELAGPAGGRLGQFEHGTIYWTGRTGAHALYGPIGGRYDEPGMQAGLGYPTTDITAGRLDPDAWREARFEHGWIYGATFADGTRPTFVVQDGTPIAQKWAADGGEAVDGPPMSDEAGAGGGGRFQRFGSGAIYWSSAHGAHAVRYDIYTFWASQHFEGGPLGYPLADAVSLPADTGLCQQFEHGWIYQAHTYDGRAWHNEVPRITANTPCAPASAAGMGSGTGTPTHGTDPRGTFDFILTGNWTSYIVPDASQVYVVACPATQAIDSCRHYALTQTYDGTWRGAAPHADGGAGTWQFRFHVGGWTADGAAVSADGTNPGIDSGVWEHPWTANSPAATVSLNDSASSYATGSGDLQWTLLSLLNG